MTSKVTTVQKPAGPDFILHLREPVTFPGTVGLDVEELIDMYERVSDHYRCDPTLMLAKVIFYLKGTTCVWYRTHGDLRSWDTCKANLYELFGRPFGCQQAADGQMTANHEIVHYVHTGFIGPLSKS